MSTPSTRSERLILLLVAGALAGLIARAQDAQPLGDTARQARQQKSRQSSPHVVTNDEIPEHPPAPQPSGTDSLSRGPSLPNYKEGKRPAEYWKSQILQQKNAIAALQRRIDTVNSSIRFAGGNTDLHVNYNERQRQKMQQVENMKSELSQLQKHVEEMQETARHQGYSSQVYDPSP
jgi:hypothetical protein